MLLAARSARLVLELTLLAHHAMFPQCSQYLKITLAWKNVDMDISLMNHF
jgi:hypothetical protein